MTQKSTVMASHTVQMARDVVSAVEEAQGRAPMSVVSRVQLQLVV